MVGSQGLLGNRQRPLVERLGLAVSGALTQIKPCPVEQSSSFHEFQTPLFNAVETCLRMLEEPLAQRPRFEVDVWKRSAHGTYGPLGPLASHDFVQSFNQDGLNESVNIICARFKVAANE